MFLVSAYWEKGRTEGTPGTVRMVLRFWDKKMGMCERNMGIEASKEEMTTTKKSEIERKLRIAYLVIMRWMEGRLQERLLEELEENTKEECQMVLKEVMELIQRQWKRPEEWLLEKMKEPIEIDFGVVRFGWGWFKDVKRHNKEEKARLEKEEIARKKNAAVEEEASFLKTFKLRKETSLLEYCDYLAAKFKSEGRHYMSNHLKSCRSRLAEFIRNRTITLSDVNRQFIAEFGRFIEGKNIAEATVSFYMRMLQLILSTAGKSGVIEVGQDWFDDVNTAQYKYKMSDSVQQKVLSRAEIQRFADYDFSAQKKYEEVRDLFMFSFYMGGIELSDMAYLTTANILPSGYLVFNRRKKGVENKILIGDKARSIINKYIGNENGYMFPMLKGSQPDAFLSLKSKILRHLKMAAKETGISQISFAHARNSWLAFTRQVNIGELLINQ